MAKGRPQLGYSNYYWIRLDQKKLEERRRLAAAVQVPDEDLTPPTPLPEECDLKLEGIKVEKRVTDSK
jgi:hypothetical protein